MADGNLYCLPMQFVMPVLMGSSDALAKAQTIDDLVEIVMNSSVVEMSFERGGFSRGNDPFANVDESERSALHFEDLKELNNILWTSASPGIVNNNSLDTDALRKYLNAIKAISDKLGLMDESPEHGSRVMTSVSTSDGASAEVLPGSLTRYFMRQTNYAAFFARNLMILQVAMENRNSDLKLFPGFDPGVWQPSVITGISADTERPGFAAEFVQTMLSLDVQKLSYGTGLPVTHAGMAAQIEALNDTGFRGDMGAFDFDIDPLMSQLKTVSLSDTVLKDMIWDIVERCCRGDIDVDGAVREIELSIRTYLAERG